MFNAAQFGIFVRERRLELGLTQTEVVALAKRAGYPLSQATLAKLEGGDKKTEPNGSILKGLALALEVTPNQLMGHQVDRETKVLFLHRPESLAVASLMDNMTPEHRTAVQKYAQQIISLEEIDLQRNEHLLEDTLEALRVTEDPALRRKALEILTRTGEGQVGPKALYS